MSTRYRGITLDEDDFRQLVAGGTVAKDGVYIILADIGWARMEAVVHEAHLAAWDKEMWEKPGRPRH